MAFLTGRRVSSKEDMATQSKEIRTERRKLAANTAKLRRQEVEKIKEIRAYSKMGRHAEARERAKQLARVRNEIRVQIRLDTQYESLSAQLGQAETRNSTTQIVTKMTRTMTSLNKRTGYAQTVDAVHKFEYESAQLKEGSELMDSALDDMFAGSDEEVDADDTVSSIMDELGLEQEERYAAAPAHAVRSASATAAYTPEVAPTRVAADSVGAGMPSTPSDRPGSAAADDDDLVRRFNLLNK